MNVALRSEPLNIISLCTGGAGLDLGIELAVPGARTVCMVEREAFGVATLVSAMEAGLLHAAPIWSNARTFDGRPWRGAVDGVIGGIPCQPHSLAGKRLGAEDERDLWSTARRIIVQSGAWFVLIENVRGMLSSGGAERVWRDLHRLGFEVEGGLFTAAEVGASHERERLFILAVADNAFRRRGYSAVAGQSRPEQEPHRGRGRSLADADSERLEGIGTDAAPVGWPDERRSAGLRDRAVVDDASIARGRGISVQPRRQVEAGTNSDWAVGAVDDAISQRWREGRHDHGEHERLELVTAGQLSVGDPDANPSQIRESHASLRGRRSEQPAGDRATGGSLGLFAPRPSDFESWRRALEAAPELEPAFRRVADGLASRLDIGRVDRLRMLGNGVVPLEGAYAFSTLAARLAARGSAAAIQLVRMMEGIAA